MENETQIVTIILNKKDFRGTVSQCPTATTDIAMRMQRIETGLLINLVMALLNPRICSNDPGFDGKSRIS